MRGTFPLLSIVSTSIHSFSCLTFGKVTLVYQPRDDMAVLKVEVVMATKDVGRDYAGEHAAVLLVVRSVW